jgi:Glycosyl transferases group 1
VNAKSANILAFATKGTDTNEELRMRRLLSATSARFLAFDKKAKHKSFRHVISRIFRERPDLVVMEGSGVAGGLACLLARILGRTRYVISSGDAVGPFVSAHSLLAGPVFAIYERLLCRLSDGFIGWTPYLSGRALTFGTPRAMTACGWAPAPLHGDDAAEARKAIRQKLNIAPDAIVFGLLGAVEWNPRRQYCYGMELVHARHQVKRSDVCVLVVGGGTGLEKLRGMAGDMLGSAVFLPGPCPLDQVSTYLAAMDLASLPQSRDGVGNFRYTTKISEYAAAGLPMITGRLPLAYDLDDGSMLRLPGKMPWSPEYISALAKMMNDITPQFLASAQARVERIRSEFDPEKQVHRVTRFISDLLDEILGDQALSEPAVARATPERGDRAAGLRPVPEASNIS